MNSLRYSLEKYGFRVCSRLADFLGIKSKHVRLAFIYSSFFGLGIGFFIYLVLAFELERSFLLDLNSFTSFETSNNR